MCMCVCMCVCVCGVCGVCGERRKRGEGPPLDILFFGLGTLSGSLCVSLSLCLSVSLCVYRLDTAMCTVTESNVYVQIYIVHVRETERQTERQRDRERQ